MTLDDLEWPICTLAGKVHFTEPTRTRKPCCQTETHTMPLWISIHIIKIYKSVVGFPCDRTAFLYITCITAVWTVINCDWAIEMYCIFVAVVESWSCIEQRRRYSTSTQQLCTVTQFHSPHWQLSEMTCLPVLSRLYDLISTQSVTVLWQYLIAVFLSN